MCSHDPSSRAEHTAEDLLIHRQCPTCDGNDTEPYLAKRGLEVVRCRGCRMIFANPVAREYASGTYYDRAGQTFYLSEAKLAGDYAPVRFDRELATLRRLCPRGDVLDVGCSSGGFLFQLQKRFPGEYQVIGTDVSGPALDYAESRGIPVTRGDFLSQDFGGRKFDVVTFWAVLEHVAAPAAFLKRAQGLLKEGGFCFVLVPNMKSLAVRSLGARYRYIYPQHLNYWTATTLRRSLEPCFQIREMRTSHFNPVVIWQDFRSGGKDVPNEDRARLLQRTTKLKQSPWAAPARAVYGVAEGILRKCGLADNLIAIARKRQ